MSDTFRGWLMDVLKVPPAPRFPDGVRVFRASPSYLRYRQVVWGLRQVGVVVGLVVGWIALQMFVPGRFYDRFEEFYWVLEGFAWLAFAVQLVFGLALTRLDYDLRWYVLSDRSLHIREGIVSVREKTMTFANIQQVSIRQNPLQRLLGIADVKVETAGGGGSSKDSDASEASVGEHLHEAHFRGVDNAEEIREAVLARLRRHADAGLGDTPDLEHATPSAPAPDDALMAARELLSEMRALRQALPARSGPTPTP